MRIFSYIFFLIIIIFGVTFAALNATPVNLNYYMGSRSISLSLLLALVLGVGIILGLIIALFPLFRLKKENYRLRHQLKQQDKQVSVIS